MSLARAGPDTALDAILRRGPVIPVVTIDDPGVAVPLARALRAGGIEVIEVALRTPGACAAIERIRAEVPQMIVGAGTVRGPEQLAKVARLGVAFAATPGITPRLLAAAAASPVPVLFGIASASEAMLLLEHGRSVAKFFPAESCGGPEALRTFAGPFPDLRFCPTGGIGPDTAPLYLALPNVLCVGGSWLAPRDALAAGDWARITDLARAATTLASEKER
ncbi:MAG: bifunctional 4-hydroxy-2-oxoglutarate aldolase/2-dehydro-3-deoxy-phosphogluconate aldolase [Geminicoccaceae bacterium]|nr:bifunctional 4-hydroxy-2-oxoglutarate aldolase/2-dehydro-3-deoxy-phosphogluconate aldolase [Geminicoccaceae bacterium]MCS7267945.1 bifunctional 4-hydroxy-2-oxoglutarate aldolase/2-dehydro-3-deoxy-phosphogluconate aldolase [Geminicoccaceae bacterium]MCX7630341.1 bifunctional 4-hydroxy-2-oxoglutarate aldolase/2-dehydro-3-deoxy-phosphogluconate aldolase [Geminicoccaceae bacterium]MDW8124425.1 bifunctional 4-hydroxy-2-oxoglutarate aldolase/2-dehydro-3-deoxy-phosphogluconate aldolase [Geminicoccac